MCAEYYGPPAIDSLSSEQLRCHYAAIAPETRYSASNIYDPMSLNYSIYGQTPMLSNYYTTGLVPPVTGGIPAYNGSYPTMGGGTTPTPSAETVANPATSATQFGPANMFDQMDQWTDYMYDRNVKYTEKGRSNQARLQSPYETATFAAKELQKKVVCNEHSQIPQFFENYKTAIKALYPQYSNMSDRELTAEALKHYTQTTGQDLENQIRTNSRDIFAQKYLHYMTLGMFAKGSAEETIEQITGEPMNREDKVKSKLALGAAVVTGGTIARFVIPNTGKILGTIARNPLTALVIGAGALAAYFCGGSSK